MSIVKTCSGNITVLSVAGNTHLGGQDFLNRLVEYVVGEVETRCNVAVRENKRFMWSIIGQCERAKKILATAKSTTVVPEFLATSELEITREKFEELNEDLFKETIKIVDACIKNRRLSREDIDEVLLEGGASRIPKLEALLKEYFNNKPIQRNINADEAIAIGAAIEADFVKNLQGASSLLIDVLPLSIGTVLDEDSIFFNFARNTPLPANSKHNHVVKNSKQRRQGCILSVYEGGDLVCSKNVLLGAHEIKWIKPSAKNRNIEVTMQINNYGIIWITARGDTIKTFSIALNKGRLEEDEIGVSSERIHEGET